MRMQRADYTARPDVDWRVPTSPRMYPEVRLVPGSLHKDRVTSLVVSQAKCRVRV